MAWVMATVALAASAASSMDSHKAIDPTSIRLLFVGDILLSRNVVKERNTFRHSPWRDFGKFFQEADWVMGNLEGAVGPSSECPPDTLGPCFAIPDSLILDLKEAGFSALSTANNHGMDLGEAGRMRTRASLLRNGLLPLGFPESPFFRNIDGHTLAFISLSLAPDKYGHRHMLPDRGLAQKFRLARNFAEGIVVFIHWGKELQDWPDQDQIDAAHWLISQGADLIIGAHPHVVQPPVCLGGTPVFFSLGNHLFDQKYPATKQGLVADCAWEGRGFACGSIWTRSGPNGYFPRLAGAPDSAVASRVCSDTALESRTSNLSARSRGPRLESRWIGDSLKSRWTFPRADGSPVAWESRASSILAASVFKLKDKPDREFLFRLENHFSTLDHEIAPRPYVYEVTGNGPIARWRGSALAWPLLDAAMPSGNEAGMLCALHRGDSFLVPDSKITTTRIAAYRWNGFGFAMDSDSLSVSACRSLLGP